MGARRTVPALALVNCRAITLDAAQSEGDAILVEDYRIVWVGDGSHLSPATLAAADVINCGGKTVVPGFIDAHCHILAYAASLIAVDCSPDSVSSIADILREVGARAKSTPHGEWIRAFGYSEFELTEKRHPTRWELDRVSPHHPVRLNHRSGHACVLNSLALDRVGIRADTEEPMGSTIGRDMETAEPNGLLLEMDAWLEGRIPPLTDDELCRGVSQASRQFLSQGVTSVMDATPSNSPDRWNLLRRFRTEGKFAPSLSIMPAAGRLNEFESAGLGYSWADGLSTLGHAKMVLTRSSGRLFPDAEELRAIVEDAHSRGFPAAIHAVEAEAVTAAAEALAASRAPGLRDRIEHASECPPDTLEALLRARPVVASQPRFLRDSGARYHSEFGDEARWLYRFKALSDCGVVIAASSDAPVSAPNPLIAMHAAVTRCAASGEVIGADERITAQEALEMHTGNAAYAACSEGKVGTISIGKHADLAVLSDDPTKVAAEDVSEIEVTMTIAKGKVVWQG